ncbi:Mov34/MPN/PAD-1 family protein [Polaromonas sp.]|uniref:Mov34/MPN/PAD-1 family protein n=1 Tax=Polaromonas sp. TaxID=1869339 RepID=UPI003BABAB99
MMQEDWKNLVQGDIVEAPSELRLSRARAIAEAIVRHPDYTLVRCSRIEKQGILEVLVVDVECNAVPPKNPAGIEFRERLALIVPDKPEELVEVLALRNGFPRLMHQNARPPGWPPSLCLYFEPTRSITRTWTAESFLQRMQIWLEKSSRGELHPADQPVEQMFFAAPNELILPWNIDALLQQVPTPVFAIMTGPERGKGAQSFSLVQRVPGQNDSSPSLSLVQLNLPPVVHGRIEADPPTLGGVADMLRTRDVDLVQALKGAIHDQVDAIGVPVGQDTKGTIVLLHMPITRAEGQPAEKIVRRGYLVEQGAFKLGELTGTLFQLNGRFFREPTAEFLAHGEQLAWRELEVTAIEVIRNLDRKSARFQSGLVDNGPTGTVVGAGALGATLLDLWGRSGWGQWAVIDKDHIKPHNLVRHPADQRHLGLPKEQVAVERHAELMNGASTITGVHADACDFVDGKPLPSIQTAELVVDVSTTLDYPRLMSTRDDVGRHVSAFLTPKANASVILMEDADRLYRARTLEAQYYRAVMEQPWGADHLAGNHGTFWSGAGCRDISLVMSYSAVVAHGALLAEQVRTLFEASDAAIRVWVRDAQSGAITAHVVPVCEEQVIDLENMALCIDAGVVEKMHSLRKSNFPNETGGILLGYHDLNVNAIVVVDALAAPPDSRSSPASFERGVLGVADAAKEAHKRTAGIVGYIGEWHSHPPGHSAEPSYDDFYQLVYLALGMSHDGLAAVSLIVGSGGELQALKCAVR